MGTSPEVRTLLDQEWRPPWRHHRDHVGDLVAASSPSWLATLIELPANADRAAVRAWLAAWLQSWAAAATTADLVQPASFLYLVLRRVPGEADAVQFNENGAVAEYGYGRAPRAPSEWEEQPLRSLLERVLGELTAR